MPTTSSICVENQDECSFLIIDTQYKQEHIKRWIHKQIDSYEIYKNAGENQNNSISIEDLPKNTI